MKLLGRVTLAGAHALAVCVHAKYHALPLTSESSSLLPGDPRNAYSKQNSEHSVASLESVSVGLPQNGIFGNVAETTSEYTLGQETPLEIVCAEDRVAELAPSGSLQERNMRELEVMLDDVDLERAASGEINLFRKNLSHHIAPVFSIDDSYSQ